MTLFLLMRVMTLFFGNNTPGGLPNSDCKRIPACSLVGNDAPFLPLVVAAAGNDAPFLPLVVAAAGNDAPFLPLVVAAAGNDAPSS